MHPTTLRSRANPSDINRVLRNTYWLLALSMVPTIGGAWIGLSTNLLAGIGPIASTMIFLVGALGLMFLVEKNKNSAAGVGFLLVFTFFMGLMLSRMLGAVLSRGNGAELIMTAFAGTFSVFCAMAILSSVIKRDLEPLGRTLMIGALLVVVAMIGNVFFQSPALQLTLAVLAGGIFSVMCLHDLQRVRDGREISYVSAALAIYLSLYNVFTSILQMLGLTSSD